MRMWYAVAVVMIFSASAVAQVKPVQKPDTAGEAEAPPPRQQEMGDFMEQMGPMMQSVMEAMYASLFRVLAKPETASQLATFTRNFYDELIKKGFTKQEALELVVGMGFPAMQGAQ